MTDAAAPGAGAGGETPPLGVDLVPPCRFLVRATAGARVIGKGGQSIKAIRASTGASVKVLQEELPEALRRRQECIVLASCGEAAALRGAVGAILDRVFDRSGLPDHAERDRERPFIVDVVVPERAGGLLVGASGEHIRALIEELGCDLNVVREPLPGIAAQKRVRVLSRERQRVDAGVWRLQEALAGFLQAGSLAPEDFELREAPEQPGHARAEGEEVPLRLLLAQGETAAVVGRLGGNVARLRDIARASVDDAEAPPFDPAERVLLLSQAPLGDRLRAARLALSDLAVQRALRAEEAGAPHQTLPEGERPIVARLVLPHGRWDEVAESLHEAGGAPCRLQVETGCRTAVRQPGWNASGAGWCVVELDGTEDGVAAAVWRLHQALEPWEPREVPPRLAPAAAREDAPPERPPPRAAAVEPRRPAAARPADSPPPPALATAAPSAGGGFGPAAGCGFGRAEAPLPQREEPAAAPAAVARAARERASGTQREEASEARGSGAPAGAGPPLLLEMPSGAAAAFLASEASGVARRAGVQLRAPPGSPPTLEILGPLAAVATASYLVQVQLWLLSAAGGPSSGPAGAWP